MTKPQQQKKGSGLTTYITVYELSGSAIEMPYSGSFREALQATYREIALLYSTGAIAEILSVKIIHQATEQPVIELNLKL